MKNNSATYTLIKKVSKTTFPLLVALSLFLLGYRIISRQRASFKTTLLLIVAICSIAVTIISQYALQLNEEIGLYQLYSIKSNI